MQDPRLEARLSALQRQHDLSDEAVLALGELLDEVLGVDTLISQLDPIPSTSETTMTDEQRYVWLERIGRGGTGEVWRVQDQVLGRTLASKVLHAGPERGQDLLAEAKATAQLRHPAIVTVHDVGVMPDGRMFYTMEEVHGITLLTAIRERVPGPVDAALRTLLRAVATVAQGLAYAHDQGVLHRDVKPQNIMLGNYGEVRLLDFGVGVLGTPSYLAPELLDGSAHPGSDQYALGATLYHVVAGHPPYQGPPQDVLHAVRAGPPPSLEGPEPLVQIMERTMAREPLERFASCSEVAEALLDFLNGVLAEQRAMAHVREAETIGPSVRDLRSRAVTLAREAREALRALPSFAPVRDKRPHWDKEAEAASLLAMAERQDLAALQSLRFAEREAPELATVHEALADYWRAEHQRLEHGHAAEAALSWLSLHDRGTHASYLRGWGALTLRTSPAGARVRLFRVVPRARRLGTEFVRDLGTTPLVETPVEHGSYVLLVSHPDGWARIPVQVGRLENVDPHGLGGVIALPPSRPSECYVPAGWAQFGSKDRAQRTGMGPRRIWVDSFVMQRFPVTNREYLEFLDDLVANGRSEEANQRAAGAGSTRAMSQQADGRFALVPDAEGDRWELDWPVFEVSWDDANAYAGWLGSRTGEAWRLPGELEWEKAARGVDGRRFPWGNEFEDTWCNMRNSRPHMLPTSIYSHPVDASPYGVRGLAGNLSDWCLERYGANGPELDERSRWHPGRPDVEGTEQRRTVRGGCWAFNAVACATTYRLALLPDSRRSSTSFRLVRSIQTPG